ncbi:MAG TPA: nitric oxide synthase oxygenase [Ktedonobacteraceae bacterium]|nr:nitric oxide synthase oxygenase [Ktedonobacteraceae bacterium]
MSFSRQKVDELEAGRKTCGQGPSHLHNNYELFLEARAYLQLFHQECDRFEAFPERLTAIQDEIKQDGTYRQTYDELLYGAKVAWRNNTRCIGRLHWQSLVVRDMRHLSTAEEIFSALVDHIRCATNGGKIRSTITIFAPQAPGQPGIRIWNPQLIRYAGYRQPDGSIVGDPANQELTAILQQLGWKGGQETSFDLLPLVIQMPNQHPRMFMLPEDAVLEVPLSHPDYSWFAELGLKWHALPVISNMRMEIGGISYTAAPFNGWYMGTEIGARNLGDVNRYNLLPVIAKQMGLDTRSDRTLWKDRALVELNIAVLSSFARYGVTAVDHHTASRQFLLHDEQEQRVGRTVPAHWVWIVPPISGSASPIFHKTYYKNTILKPNYFYQAAPWQEQPHVSGCPMR